MMNLRKVLLIACACLFSLVFAKLPEIDLMNYTCPNTQWQTLEVQNYMNAYNNTYHNYADTTGLLDSETHYLTNDLQLDFDQTKITRSEERSISGRISLYSHKNSSYQLRDSVVSADTLNNNSVGLWLSFTQRYYSKNNFFVELGATASSYNYMAVQSRRSGVSSLIIDINGNDFELYAPIKFGKGRIENVTSAQQAIYILDELIKQGRVRDDLTAEDIDEFADYICTLNSKRFFDTRLQRIEEIESLDSFLLAQNLVVDNDAHYVASLNDMWNYGKNVMRQAGNSAALVVIPGCSYRNTDYDRGGTLTDMNEKYTTADVGIELKHYHPINLYWQNNIKFDAFAGAISNTEKDEYDTLATRESIPNIRAALGQQLIFMPNTRTDVYLSYYVNYAYVLGSYDTDLAIIREGGHYLLSGLDFAASYYISPKLRLSFSANFDYIWIDSESNTYSSFGETSYGTWNRESANAINTSRFYNTINLNLVYKIF